jgi:hypothetical protein
MWGRVSVGLAAVLMTAASIPAAAASPGVRHAPTWVYAAEQFAQAHSRAHGHSAARASAHAAATTAATATVPSTVQDASGDVPSGKGDITAAGFVQNSSGLVFGVKVKTPADPKTDAAWLNGLPFVFFALDTNKDAFPEYLAMLFPDFAGGLTAGLGSLESAVICDGTGHYVAGYGYTMTFPKRCLPAGLKFRFQAAMSYTTDVNDQNPPTDFAPDGDTFSPTLTTASSVGSTSAASGYWMLGADGRVYPFGGAVGFPGLTVGATAMAPRKDGKGYWVTDGAGHVRAFGTAGPHGGSPLLGAGERITSISATPSGRGYWLFSDLGRSFAFGDAHSYGDMAGTHLNGKVVASTATPSGKGYYMIGRDGGIFAFGDARFYGSTGGMRLNRPIVGMSPTPKGDGYWLVGSDGGVFAFHAPFRGSMGAVHLNQPVDGLVAYGNGYLMGAADGGVFNFSNKAFAGSLANHPPTAPIIGITAFGS